MSNEEVTPSETAAAAPAESPAVAKLKSDLADHIISATEDGKTLRVEATPAGLLEVCDELRLRDEFQFDYPADLTAWDTGESFVVWYRLWSMARGRNALVRVTLGREDPAVPSLSGLWPGFNWFEREAYDLYGIRFTGHPEQHDPSRMRILLPEDWVGFPFRKDYEPTFEDNPLHGPQRTN